MSIFYPQFRWYSPTKRGTQYFADWNEASAHAWQKLLAFPYFNWKDESSWISTDLTSLKTNVSLKLMFGHVGEYRFGTHGVQNQYLDWKIDISIPHWVLVNTSSGELPVCVHLGYWITVVCPGPLANPLLPPFSAPPAWIKRAETPQSLFLTGIDSDLIPPRNQDRINWPILRPLYKLWQPTIS